jgi:Holliday junction DNA helicase RuvA
LRGEAERTLFDLLTSVKGVGPGTALRILSGASVEDLRDSILAQDRGRLTRVKGIGPKSAERILLELREKIAVLGVEDMPALQPEEANKAEAITAMVSLGFDPREARKTVDAAIKKLGDRAASDELVRQALQEATR